MVLGGAFTALLLLISGVSAVNVQPPTGVNVSCANLKVTVQWEYSEQQPGTVFLVTPVSSARCPSAETWRTTEHQYDLTRFIWQSEECYMDYIHVSVRAVQGDDKSESVGSSFSFNRLKTVDIYCELDFPPVNLEQTDSGSRVTFVNPFHFYTELGEANRPDEALFDVDVVTDHGNNRFKCTVTEEICKHDFKFLDGADKCVTLTGKLFNGDLSGEVQFTNMTRVCQSEPPEVIFFVILISVAVVVISLLILLICKVKAWILTTPPLPNPLRLPHKDMQGLRYDLVRESYISRARVEEPCRKTSVSPAEENDPPEPPQDGSACSNVQPPADSYGTGDLSASSSQASAEERRSGDDDSANSSLSTECVTMDSEEGAAAAAVEEEEEEEERSPYDRPHVLQVDIGDGEMVEAYTGT